jgi:hypothetical protein
VAEERVTLNKEWLKIGKQERERNGVLYHYIAKACGAAEVKLEVGNILNLPTRWR